MKRTLSVAALFVALASAERFEARYFHDQDKSSISFLQIEFPSERRGLAVGVKQTERERPQGVAVVTADGGATWAEVTLPEIPVSLFCLDDSACWMVGLRGIYFSAEGGREWRRLSGETGLRRVYFRDRERGWAVGFAKKLVETRDGGKIWKKMPVSEELKKLSDRVTFHSIAFIAKNVGLITGRSEPEDPGTPLWLRTEPEFARERPSLSIALETRDGGETWKASASSLFGRLTGVRPSAPLKGALAIIEYDRYFKFGAEVYKADFMTGLSATVFAREDVVPTDALPLLDGSALIAGFQPPGKLARTPVPGKIRILRSLKDLKIWTDIPVDYRAVGTRVSLAVSPARGVWAATDEGMILQLVP